MLNGTNLSLLLILLLAITQFQTVAATPVSANFYPSKQSQEGAVWISSCKGGKAVEVNKRLLEEDIRKFRSGESSEFGFRFYCREAFSTLKKYALDPDSNVRREVSSYLGIYYSADALQQLVRQIERYPLDKNASRYGYVQRYPCYFFKNLKVRSLTQALSARIKSKSDDRNGDEIRVLRCLASKDPESREFLEEMSQSTFQTRLNEIDRLDQIHMITYALAESGTKASEEIVMAEIEAAIVTGIPENIQSVLDGVKGFTNCRIIRRLATLILDKRAVLLTVGDGGKIKQFSARIADMAISTFTGAYGFKITGEKDVSWKPHTDVEVERIYQRVTKAVESGKYSACHSSK